MKRMSIVSVTLGIVVLVLFSIGAGGGNQPPIACFTVSPAQGTSQTTFAVDAGCSSDDKTTLDRLQVRWDWNGDGVWDTPLITTKTATHVYASEGNQTIGLLVRDQAGLTGTTTHVVLVAPSISDAPVGSPLAWEPDIDVSPLDPTNLVVGARGSATGATGTIPYPTFYSNDAAQTWTQATGIGPNGMVGDPAIEYDGDGRVFFMQQVPYEDASAPPLGVFVARSDDGGVTYPTRPYALATTSTFALPGGGTAYSCGNSVPYDYPKMGVDKGPGSTSRGNIYVSARATLDLNNDGVCDTYGMVFVRSTDHGLTWNSGQVLEADYFNVDQIGVSANGTVLIAERTTPSDPRCSSGHGIVLRKSTDGGATFTPGVCVFNPAGDIEPNFVWPASHPSDASRLWMAFDARVNSLASQHIFVMRSTDGGAAWSAPVRVDDTVLDDHVDHYAPSLAVSSSGRLDMAWFDYRNATPTTVAAMWQPIDVYHSVSTNGGVSWAGTAWGTSNIRLSPVTASAFVGGHSDFLTTVSSGNKTWVAYSQDRRFINSLDGHVAILTYH